jgi:hypothetical protein
VLLAAQGGDRSVRLGLVRHLDEPEAAALAREAVRDHLRALDRSVLRKEIAQRVVVDIVAQVSDIDLLGHSLLLERHPRSCGFHLGAPWAHPTEGGLTKAPGKLPEIPLGEPTD